MHLHGCWRRALFHGFVPAVLALQTGCLTHLEPMPVPNQAKPAPGHEVPHGCHEHVHIFLINGLDPLDCSDMAGVRHFIEELGYGQVWSGQVYHALCFCKEIERIRHEDPEARFVLIGHSIGANAAKKLTECLRDDCVGIDLLVYLNGNTVRNVPASRPKNAARVVVIRCGWFCTDKMIPGAEHIDEPDVCHFDSPTYPATLESLERELAMVASTVPYEMPAEPEMPHALSEAPTPRPIVARSAEPRDEWDFLKPVARLGQPPSAAQVHEAAKKQY